MNKIISVIRQAPVTFISGCLLSVVLTTMFFYFLLMASKDATIEELKTKLETRSEQSADLTHGDVGL